MKKPFLFLLSLITLIACQQARHQAARTDWKVYTKAYAFLAQQKDSAFYYFNQVAATSKDSLQVAMSYNIMAMIQSDAGDYYGAQESLSLSLKSLDEQRDTDRATLASVYNELGMSSTNLKNYGPALLYFDKAIHLAGDTNLKNLALNNKALAYQKKKDYRRALGLYRQLIKKSVKNGTDYARILTNLATTAWLNDPHYPAGAELHQALRIREAAKDRWGLNSSYLSLAAYYVNNRPDSALYYAQERYAVARELNSPDDQMEALAALVNLLPAGNVKPYFARYTSLSDSLQTARSAAKNQFALLRYHVGEQQTANLRLQKDNSERKFQLSVLLIILLAVVAGSLLWYRKIRLQAREKLRQNELRLSQKVHDVVANGIYRVMNEVEYGPELDKEQLLDQLELMYEQSRDITYEKETPVNSDFAEKITTLLNAFKSGSIKLAVSGNETALWQAVRPAIQAEVAPMLQELMVNMTKHSRASQALVAFELHNHTLLIDYRDNGVGLPDHFDQGNGLRNTGNRIKALRGDLKFVKEAAGGARIQLLIPLS
ncbi:MAG: ATP-binding protein [Bacteroidota bacterium]